MYKAIFTCSIMASVPGLPHTRGKCGEGLEPRLIYIVYMYNVLCVHYYQSGSVPKYLSP